MTTVSKLASPPRRIVLATTAFVLAASGCAASTRLPSAPPTAELAPPSASPTPRTAEPNREPAPSAARPKINGRLEPAIIQKVVREGFGGMRKCYEEGLGRDPKLNGKLVTRFVIARDGTVSESMDALDRPHSSTPEVMGPPDEPRFPDPKVVACVVARFKELKFPAPEGGIVTVMYPVVFSPGED